MSQHASDVRTVKILFLTADLSKVKSVNVMPIIRSLMHILFIAYPMASKKSKKKRRKCCEFAYSL
jgi:hypothetical protein